jgi:hypothetical protein
VYGHHPGRQHFCWYSAWHTWPPHSSSSPTATSVSEALELPSAELAISTAVGAAGTAGKKTVQLPLESAAPLATTVLPGSVSVTVTSLPGAAPPPQVASGCPRWSSMPCPKGAAKCSPASGSKRSSSARAHSSGAEAEPPWRSIEGRCAEWTPRVAAAVLLRGSETGRGEWHDGTHNQLAAGGR